MLLEVDHPVHGRVVVCRTPIKFEGRPPPVYAIHPDYGADNESVYCGRLGLEAEALECLREEGVI